MIDMFNQYFDGKVMVRTDRGYKLSTGRMIDANEGILGLDEKLRLTEGYDGMVYFHDDDYNDAPLTKEERYEIARYMIKRWNQFAEGE